MAFPQQITSPPQAQAEVPLNENFETVEVVAYFGKRQTATAGLTWGYYGTTNGIYNGNVIADGTVALTNNATNYIVVLRSTGVVTASTFTTNSLSALYARLYKVTTLSGAISAIVDERLETNGLMSTGGATGTGAATSQPGEFISGYIGTVADKTYKLVVKMPHGGTITETTTISESGTCTATFKINTTPLGGTANAVSSSEQSQAQASANVVVAGDDVQLTASANSTCIGLSFTIKYTRVLA